MSNATNKNFLSSTGIAILASLGVHGLLWAVLPGLTVSQADKSPSQRTIGLVELSPQEQNRLPQVSNPVDNTLPAFASQLTQLPPAPPYITSVAPPLQLSPGSAPLYNTVPSQNSAPPLQTFQVPLPPPPTTSFPPIPYGNIPNSSNYYPIPPAPQASPFVLPPNNGLPDTPLTPDRTFPPDDEIATVTPSPEPSSQPVPANQNNRDNPPVEVNKLPERGKQELLAMRESMRSNFPPNAATATTNRSMSRSEIAAALKRQQTPINQPTTNRSMSRSEIVRALKTPSRNSSNELSQETKTALENLDNFKRQQAAVQARNPDVVTTSPIRRKLTACDRPLNDLAIVSVVVNPEGKRLAEPVLITKPRRANLTKAQDYVKNYQFTKTGKTTNYNFRLEFDYVARKCAQATPTPSSTPVTPELTTPSTATPSPDSVTPSPKVTSTPQPTPLPIDPQKPSF